MDEEGQVIGKTSNKKRIGVALIGGAIGVAVGAAIGGAQGAAKLGAVGLAAGVAYGLTMTTAGSQLEFLPGSHFTLEVSDSTRNQAAASQKNGTGGAGTVRQRVGEVSRPSARPRSSGPQVVTKFGIRNETFRRIQVFLDGSDEPIEVRGNYYQSHLEVGTTHLIRVVVGNRTFRARFTVPRVMRDIRVTTSGIVIR